MEAAIKQLSRTDNFIPKSLDKNGNAASWLAAVSSQHVTLVSVAWPTPLVAEVPNLDDCKCCLSVLFIYFVRKETTYDGSCYWITEGLFYLRWSLTCLARFLGESRSKWNLKEMGCCWPATWHVPWCGWSVSVIEASDVGSVDCHCQCHCGRPRSSRDLAETNKLYRLSLLCL